ncbi:hypothetical protein CDL15_Pgr004759 [Punica granatum]|uniref:Strictosidine synthase conserved region domain-containing protein n=1 Tax=Punica granatum TaxID=22663 RepID=A0A218W5X9_PUNGR|nr:hypothetical protein CDL15_Pgr004759 [Punica granatum]
MSDLTTTPQPLPPLPKHNRWLVTLLITIFLPVFAAVVIYQYESSDPAELPIHEITSRPAATAPRVNSHMLEGSERLGEGKLLGPEDLAYDPESGLIYTGCDDGWIKRVRVNDSVVEDWVNTGGRPLGLALGRHGELIVADTEKGLLRVSENGSVELLTDEAEGVKFKLTDGVDVAEDGIIYFTDASYKYRLKDFFSDLLEGRPHGRFMSFDPVTGRTDVLVRNLYFANGVAVSPNQDFVVFCESFMSRCLQYYISGEKKGTVDKFIEHLPGLPDNIRYDGEGHFWIALPTELSLQWKLTLKYPIIRKVLAILEKYLKRPQLEKNAGAFTVDLEGNPVARYCDQRLIYITGATKIGNYLYCGSLVYPYIIRLDLTIHGAC